LALVRVTQMSEMTTHFCSAHTIFYRKGAHAYENTKASKHLVARAWPQIPCTGEAYSAFLSPYSWWDLYPTQNLTACRSSPFQPCNWVRALNLLLKQGGFLTPLLRHWWRHHILVAMATGHRRVELSVCVCVCRWNERLGKRRWLHGWRRRRRCRMASLLIVSATRPTSLIRGCQRTYTVVSFWSLSWRTNTHINMSLSPSASPDESMPY